MMKNTENRYLLGTTCSLTVSVSPPVLLTFTSFLFFPSCEGRAQKRTGDAEGKGEQICHVGEDRYKRQMGGDTKWEVGA